MINVENKYCTGCGACVQACNKNCIQLIEDKTGFIYPKIDDKTCINCNLCERACPVNKDTFNVDDAQVYACTDNNLSNIMQSTSGGFFSVLAEYVLKLNGSVYGCAFDNNLKAHHIRITDLDSLYELKGSKYVQSDMNDSFKYSKLDLIDGKIVLFSGTPCQIAGLKSYLGKEYENLITIDVICHGVPSQNFFDKYIKWLSNKEKGEIVYYSFRDKRVNGWSLSGLYSILKNGETKDKPLYYFEHYYYYYFLNSTIYRESCYHCKYATIRRQGDFSIGDLWGAEAFDFQFSIRNGCSIVLVNSQKGKDIFSKLNLNSKQISIEDATRHNEQLKRPSQMPSNRNDILKMFNDMDGSDIQKYFVQKNKKEIIVAKLKYLIPCEIRSKLQTFRYKRELINKK